MLAIAHSYDYRTLVLGAWGCGAFGNDATRTAEELGIHLNTAYRWREDADYDRAWLAALEVNRQRIREQVVEELEDGLLLLEPHTLLLELGHLAN